MLLTPFSFESGAKKITPEKGGNRLPLLVAPVKEYHSSGQNASGSVRDCRKGSPYAVVPGSFSSQNRKKLHRLFKVCGDSVVPDFLLTLPEDLAILFMKSGATGSRFPTECYKK